MMDNIEKKLNAAEFSDDIFKEDDLFDEDDVQVEMETQPNFAHIESVPMTIDDLFGNNAGAVTNSMDETIIKVLVIPVKLKDKIVEIFVTQDNVFSKQYMMTQLIELPDYVKDTTEESPWILPRVYPIRNSALLNKIFYGANSNGASGLTKEITKEELTLNDIKERCKDNKYEVNYINSQLTLIAQNKEDEFRGV